MTAKKPLTAREARFVEAYRLHGNASQAAREAGYAAHQANAIGWKVLRRPKIIDALREHGIEIVLTPKEGSALRKYPRTYRRNGLTVRQERFVYEYLIDGNATQAAIRAGFTGNPLDTGTRMLHQPEVASAIQRERAATAARLAISVERVLGELACIAFSDLGTVADWGPDGVVLKEKASLSRHDRAAIAELWSEKVEKTSAARSHVRMHSKQQALDALAKHLGLYGRGVRTVAEAEAAARAKAAQGDEARRLLRARLQRIIDGAEETKEEDAEAEVKKEKEEEKT